ncbi:transglutaminase domain-containing protein [Serinibacter arcticus]|uniref:Putative cysteine protease n=1 Tax=Serinibacter arcticus TaxID=1655435 RepID=A0A4Z1DZ81_9MICO|nr:transglutaminase domain-containing protein [Serinibacter arcticus]TGO04229.1 putative cysteine protease [Serinibacter arcticus]
MTTAVPEQDAHPRAWWVPVWTVALLLLGCVPYASAYAWWPAPLVLAGVVLAAFGLVLLGSLLRLARWVVGVVGVGLLAVITSTMASSGLDGVPAGARSVAPLLDALPRLLTAPRPAPSGAAFLAPAVLLVGVVALAVALAVVGTGLARGRDRADRSRQGGVAGLVGTIALQVGAALLVAGQDVTAVVVAVLTLAVAGLGWVLGDAPARAASGRRHGVALPGALVLLAATTAVVALAVPTAGAFEARRYVTPPTLPAEAVNPVPDVTGWLRGGETTLFSVTSHGGPLPQRLSLAVLPDFDGSTWRLEARLRAPGVVDEPDLPAGTSRATLDLEIAVDELGTAWLPTLGRVERITGAAPLADVDTGSLVLADGAGGSVAATDYRVRTTVDAPEQDRAAGAGVPDAVEAARYLEVPRVSDDLRAEAVALTQGATTRLEQATLLAEGIRAGRELDDAAVSGSSYGRLAEFLFLPAEEGGMRGTREQFAGSFAVLARTLGLPSRVVVGFEVPGAGSADGTGVTAATVTGADATIWAEIYLAEVGWVAFDPSPESSGGDGGGAAVTPSPAGDPGPDGEESPVADEPETLRDDVPADGTLAPDAGGVGTGAFVGGGVVIAVGLPLAALALLRERRRRRLRRAGARGAWQHVTDAAWLAGIEQRPGDDARAVAARVVGAGAEPAVLRLAERAEAEEFAPAAAAGQPGGDGGADRSRAAGEWELARRASRALRGGVPWVQRLWWGVSPAVLRR